LKAFRHRGLPAVAPPLPGSHPEKAASPEEGAVRRTLTLPAAGLAATLVAALIVVAVPAEGVEGESDEVVAERIAAAFREMPGGRAATRGPLGRYEIQGRP